MSEEIEIARQWLTKAMNDLLNADNNHCFLQLAGNRKLGVRRAAIDHALPGIGNQIDPNLDKLPSVDHYCR